MNILIHKDGQQMGPYTAELINEYLDQGILSPMDYAWHEGLDQWVELHEIDEVNVREISEQEARVKHLNKSYLDAAKNHIKSVLGAIGILFGVLFLFAFFMIMKSCLSAEKEVGLKGKVVGTYEYKDETHTFRAVFKENNLVELISRENEEEGYDARPSVFRWWLQDGELHHDEYEGLVFIYRINTDRSITQTALVVDGVRKKGNYWTWKKIQPTEESVFDQGRPDATKPPAKPEPKPEPPKAKATVGGKLWEFKTRGFMFSSPAIGSDGTVYVGSNDKKLYAIKTDSKGPAKSAWPMRGQNARHTGRAK